MSETDSSTDVVCDCDTDPIECLKHLFVNRVQLGRIKRGQCPARRPVFLRLHGVAHGWLEVRQDLPEDLRVGIFGQRPSFPAWVRFSSDLPDGPPVLKSTVGLGIKLFEVTGKKVLPPDEEAPTLDLIFQNMDVFFVNNAQEMCAFTKASLTSPAAGQAWLDDHPETRKILDEMAKEVPSVLGTSMWSVIPFRFGAGRYCKLKLEPEVVPSGADPDYNEPNYLKADFEKRLAGGDSRFKLMVQLQTNPEAMPLDAAMVRWSEEESPPVHVATLMLPQQDVRSRGQASYGEELSFNPWRTLQVHEPVGSLAEARRVVYQASAELRRNVNGQPLGEPQIPRPDTIWPGAKDIRIVSAKIYPGIGVARVGNSAEENGYYIGPEEVDSDNTGANVIRDEKGAIKRQVARFRIYGYNAAGEIVREIGPDLAEVTWKVHLANRKAQWYRYLAALDIPDAAQTRSARRNASIVGSAREELAIDPGAREIQGKGTLGPEHHFDTGSFQGRPVALGELRTDSEGRLLVLGGQGRSDSPTNTLIFDRNDPDTFANADGWFDDISDGPVEATVRLAGQEIPVEPSWVIVAPPNFAPDVISWHTMYELMTETYMNAGWIPVPEKPSFKEHVLPALKRLSNLQWVNKGFAALFGSGGPMNFSDELLLKKLSSKPEAGASDTNAELRRLIYNAFRPADNGVNERRSWPWIYGDAFGSFNDSALNNLSLTPIRQRLLDQWAEGDFIADWSPEDTLKAKLKVDEMDITDRPAMLDRAAMHYCVADAFHPGCELTWPMRHASLYRAPFRIRTRAQGAPVTDYGSELTQDIALRPDGPLHEQDPGGLTRWMALPWQADTAFCRSGYDDEYDPYLPTFWPARVPNHVLSMADYDTVMDAGISREARITAFHQREAWTRALTGNVAQQMMQMVSGFSSMGIVVALPGLQDDPDFPSVIFAETLPAGQVVPTRKAAAAGDEHEARLQRAGWESAEQIAEARRAIGL